MWHVAIIVLLHSVAQLSTGQGCDTACEWTPWVDWSACNQTCGGGYRHRDRSLCCPITMDVYECLSFCGLLKTGFHLYELCNAICYNQGIYSGSSCSCTDAYIDSCCSTEITCAPLSPPLNGTVVHDTVTLNNTVTFKCNSGFNVSSGDLQRTCRRAYVPNTAPTYWTGQEPRCTFVETCKSNPCHNNATCIDGLDQYKCNCGPYWTGTYCEIDVKPPQITMCQNDTILYTTQPSLLVYWQVPQFEDDRGSVVEVTSNYKTNSTLFPWGDWVIQYVGTKVANGLTTTCEFTISVYPHPCVPLAPPIGGALVCNGWNSKFGQICATFCPKTSDILSPSSITDLYVCGATGHRLPSGAAPNCTESLSNQDYLNKAANERIHYYNQTCTNSSTKQQIASTYIQILKDSYFATMCLADKWKDKCSPDNVQILCG